MIKIGSFISSFSPPNGEKDDIKDGIIRSCSVGYRVSEYTEQEKNDDLEIRTLVANRWQQGGCVAVAWDFEHSLLHPLIAP